MNPVETRYPTMPTDVLHQMERPSSPMKQSSALQYASNSRDASALGDVSTSISTVTAQPKAEPKQSDA